MSTNRVFLTGRLTRDIELRKAGSTHVGTLGLAVPEHYKNQAGEPVEKVHFFEVVVWGKQAENCAKHLRKGSAVLVEGKLQLERWETEEGQKRSRVRVRAERIQFLGSSKPATPPPNEVAGIA